MTELAAQLQRLLDKNDIVELLTRYLRAIDRGDVAALRACYLPGAVEQHGGIYDGPAQGYIDSIEAALTRPRSVGTHALTNVLVELDGDRAVSEHYVLAFTRMRTEAGVQDALVASRIMDDLERSSTGWGIARRRLRFDWSHELGPRPQQWLYGALDPGRLLHGEKYPDDPVYDRSRVPAQDATS